MATKTIFDGGVTPTHATLPEGSSTTQTPAPTS